jgi:hypothetical protein
MNIRISIPYKIFGATIWTRRVRRFIPDAWPVIHDGKRRLIYLRYLSILPFDKAILPIARDILKLSKYHFSVASHQDIACVVEHLDWMRLEPTVTPIFPFFSHQRRLYALPRAEFVDGTSFEFALADGYYQEWIDNPEDPAPLLQLVATICRPYDVQYLKKTGDARTPLRTEYAEHEVEFRAKLFENLDFALVMTVLRYFEGIKQMVHNFGTASGIFDKPKDNTENTTTKSSLFGWWTAFRSVAKTQNKTEEAVWNMALWRVLAIMMEEKHRADEAEKQMRATDKNA